MITTAQLRKSYEDIREELRHRISAILMDTSEENPRDCRITVGGESAMGLSSLELPRITACYQHPTEGIIYFVFDHDDLNPVEFDDMCTYDLITILEGLQ